MKIKLLLLFTTATFTMFMLHGCSEDEFWEEEFGSLAERRMTRSAGEPGDGGSNSTLKRYTYPDVYTIARNITSEMDAAWKMTLDSCNKANRCEYAFYVYWDHVSKTFYCGSPQKGNEVDNSTLNSASVALGRCDNNIDVCAFFHTHTSLEYLTTENAYKDPGASSADKNFAKNHGIPGILYDYPGRIYAGDSKVCKPKIYYVIPPTQRADAFF